MDITIKTSKASFEETKTAYITLYGEKLGTILLVKHFQDPSSAQVELPQKLEELKAENQQNRARIAACELLLQIYGEDNDENSYQEDNE